MAVAFEFSTTSSTVTLTQVLQQQVSNLENASGITNVSVTQQPQSSHVPGQPSVAGEVMVTAFTITSQGGAASPYNAAFFDGLVPASGFQALVTVIGYAPQGTSNSVLQDVLVPEMHSARWSHLSTTSQFKST